MSELRQVPPDWRMVPVGAVCNLGRGRVISQIEIDEHPGEYPVYSSQSKNEGVFGHLDTFDFEGEYVTWTTDGAYAGTVFYRSGKFNCTNVCGTLEAKSDDLNMKYLAYALSVRTRKHVSYVGNPKLMNNVMAEILVPLPPPSEQRRIAEILDAADEATRQTERVIAKLKAVKAGLLHDLLTRGLDEHGHRRDPEAHPEQFKDSPLGKIPREWQMRQLGDLAQNKGDYGSGAAALEYNSDLPRYVRITDITDDGHLDPNSRASIRRSDAEGYYLQRGDLVFARSGATVGKTYLYNDADGECAHAGYVIKFSLDFDLCDPRFVFYWTQSGFYWVWVNRTLRQGAQPNINAQEYRRSELVYPLPEEQRRIVAILDAHDARIRAEEAELAKLRQVKRGLMGDLLTGRVRVV